MPFRPRPGELLDDTAAASAAYLVNLLPGMAKLPMKESLRRLHGHFWSCLMAYRHLAREQRRAKRKRARPGKDASPERSQ